MISLIFKILADATGFNKTLKTDLPATAKEGGKKAGNEAGGSFGKEFGNQVKGAVMSAIGVSAIAAAIRKSVEDAKGIATEAAKGGISVEAAQELQRASKISGLSVDEIKASATTAPEQFSALMRYAQKTGGPKMAESDVEELTSIGSGFSGAGSAIGIIASKVSSAVTGTVLSAWSALEYGAGNLRYNLGRGGADTDRLMMSGVQTEMEAQKRFERVYGIAQGDLKNPTGDLIRKLEEIKQTMEKKL